MKKVLIKVNTQAVAEKTQKTTELINLIETTKESIKQLTDGNVTDSNMEAIDTYLNEKTGFLNGRMSAMAFNQEALYDRIKSLLPKLDSLKDYVRYIKKGDVNKAKIEQDSTAYLADRYTKDYLKLKELIDAINTSESGYVLSNAIQVTREGLLITPQQYQAVKSLAKR